MNGNVTAPAMPGRAAAQSGGAGAGLVSYKTNGICINFSPAVTAERRIKRLKKSVWASGHLHGMADKGFRAPVAWFVTLTYARADEWASNHVSDAIRGYRNWCKDRGVQCRYTWVAEIQPGRLQRSGKAVVHYHIMCWLPAGVRMRQWDRRTVSKSGKRCPAWWPHGMTNTDVAKAGVGYLMKYLSKLGEMMRFPKGLRLYGIGGLDTQARSVRRWYNLPEWCKAEYGVGEVLRKKMGLLVVATGEILAPAYACQHIPGGMVVKALRELAQKFHDGAYSTFPRVS